MRLLHERKAILKEKKGQDFNLGNFLCLDIVVYKRPFANANLTTVCRSSFEQDEELHHRLGHDQHLWARSSLAHLGTRVRGRSDWQR